MDILKILKESGKELYAEDLDFFETELATGEGYDDVYQEQCHKLIDELRGWLCGDNDETSGSASSAEEEDKTVGVVVSVVDIAPKEVNPVASSLTWEQTIFSDILCMRENNSYKTNFKHYVAGKGEIDAAFVDKNYSFFREWELDAIISVRQMGEEFLEKYFGALDRAKIARYQLFSEGFFMKHFSQMDASIVLEHGKNEWRKKENRSKQLDVFLRLKGVKL